MLSFFKHRNADSMWDPETFTAAEPARRASRRIQSATPSSVRDVNRVIVLNLVRQHQPISRVGLSHKSGIFRSSVSAIVDELLGEGLLIEERSIPKGRGRVPVHLYLNPDGLRVLGVSIRKFQSRVVTAGISGQIEKTIAFATPQHPASLVNEVGKAIERIRAEGGKALHQVGISVPGLVNTDTGDILMIPALSEYAGYPICKEIQELAGAHAVADNDSKAGALAERWLNEAEVAGLDDFVLVHVAEFGVGTGLILNGEIYRGHDHTWVGEFGHMIIDPSGPRCNCGRNGCWELYVSDSATWNRFDTQTDFTPERFASLVALALDGDRKAINAFKVTAEYLSLGLSNIVFGLNPQRVIVAGELTKVWGLIHQTIENAYSAGKVKVRAYPARFGLDVLASQGAAVLALMNIFAPPKLG